MNDPDIRWKQRFSQFEKAFALLQSAMAIEHPSIVERAGLIQFFEMTFEIGWKLLKDFLEAEGYVETFARRHERHENKAKICEKAEFTRGK
jgi:hypothetical protein